MNATRSTQRILCCSALTLAVLLFNLAQWRGAKPVTAAAPPTAFAFCPAPQFGAPANFAAGNIPNGAAVGDFDLDGKLDVAITNYATNHITVLLGDGAGNLQTGVTYGVGNNAYAVAVGYFNADNKPDLVVTNQGSAFVSVLLGNGTSTNTFQPAVNYPTAPFAHNLGVAVSDVNRDGKQDIVVAMFSPEAAAILLGNGDGTFQAATSYAAGLEPTAVVVGDFDRDGNQDLAVGNSQSNDLSLLRGNGDGTFQAQVTIGLGAVLAPQHMAVGDFNADGKLDLVTANRFSNNLSVLRGNGDGTFAAATNISLLAGLTSVAVGDFNSDGKQDLAVTNSGTFAGNYNVAILQGDGAGEFAARVNFGGMPDPPRFAAVGDFNGDGKHDLITANDPNTLGTASIFLNTCSCTPPDVTPTAPAQVCASSAGNTVSIPSAGAGASYTWTNYGFNGTITSATNTPSITFTAGATGTMTLGVTVTNASGCTSSKLIYIPITPTPASFTVNDLGDSSDANAGNGVCNDGSGKCTLRAAVEEANALAVAICSPLTINFSVTGTINLNAALPNLLHPNLTLNGPGPNLLTVRRNGASDFGVFLIYNPAYPLQAATIQGLTITNGYIPNGYGGGILSYARSLTLNNCVISGNTARGGGGVYPTGATGISGLAVTINNCAITGNTAQVVGGGINLDVGTMTITNSTISGNVANQYGGGVGILSTAASGVTIINSTVSGNTALGSERGGGIYVDSTSQGVAANVSLLNCTVAHNTGSVTGGGGIYNEGATSTVTYKNTLVANNTGPNFVNVGGTLTSQGNNLSSDGTGNLIAAGDKPNTNPQLVALANNGGPTQTHALLCNSPAINAGTSIGAPATDQRGIPRPQGAGFDIGAFEYNTTNTPPVLGTYPTTGPINAGAVTTVTPNAPPTDDGMVVSLTASALGFTGTFIGDPMTGVITVSNAGPVGSYTVTVTVTDNCGATTNANFALEVVACPQITITEAPPNSYLPTGVPDALYSQSFTQTGGTLPVTWSVSAGALPPGLTLSTAGLLAGTPSTIGTYDFTVQVTSGNGCFGTRAYKLTISCATLTPAPGANTAPMQGDGNSIEVTAPSGCNWTADSSVPWIILSGNRVRGGNGTVNYTVAPNPNAVPRTGMLTIAGYRFFVQQAATGLLVSEDFENGIPPSWTVLDGGSGGGTASTWITTNPCGRVAPPPFSGLFALADAACAGPGSVQDEQLITPPFDATGLGRVVLQFYNQFKLDFGPTHIGDVDVSLDNGSTWVNAFRQVTAEPTPTLKTVDITNLVAPNPANVRVRFHYYGSFSGRNGPAGGGEVIWPIDACHILHFALNATSQIITLSGGTGSVNVTAAAGATWTAQSNAPWITGVTPGGTGSGTVNFTIAPNPNPTPRTGTLTVAGNIFTVNQAGTCNMITINPPTLPAGRAGTAYSQTLTQTGGAEALTWMVSAGSLPAGLTLTASGLLSGTPTVFGTFNFTVTATDANFCQGTRGYGLVINATCGTLTVNPATLVNGFVGTAYTQTLTATGGTAPYSFGVTTGKLPGGLTLASGGALTGTPTAAGTFNFTVTATDANGCTGTRNYTVFVSGGGLQFYPLAAPVRALETRAPFSGCVNPGAPINANTSFTLAVRTGCTGIPANATAVTGNVTVVPGATGGYLTLFPSSATQPIVANSNFKPDEVTNNVFTTGLGASDGAFKIFASATTEVIVDITGYYAPPAANGLYFHPLPEPLRLVETRTLPGLTGCIKPGAPLAAGQDFAVQGRAPIAAPCNAIPTAAQVLVGNATSVFPNGGGFLTIFPSNAGRPLIASSNYAGSDIINGPFAVKLGADGQFKVFTQQTTDLVIDILGYYSAEATDANGAGLLFNSLDKPVRLLETRPDPGFPLTGCYRPNAKIVGGTGGIRTQQSWGTCEGLTIPLTARALIGNATVVNVEGAGFMTFYPGNVGTAPTVATSNYPAPVVFGYNRHFIVGVSPTDGTFKVLTQFTTDLIVDVAGYFAP